VTRFALVLAKLSAIALPLGVLAWCARVYPQPRLIYLALVPAATTIPR